MFGDFNGQIKLRTKQKFQFSFCYKTQTKANLYFTHSAGALEYNDCIYTEG